MKKITMFYIDDCPYCLMANRLRGPEKGGNGNMNRKLRLLIAISVILLVTLSGSGCSGKTNASDTGDEPAAEDIREEETADETKDSEPQRAEEAADEPQVSEKYRAALESYIDVLTDNEEKIKRYDWQLDENGEFVNKDVFSEDSDKRPVNKCVAIQDLNGDGVPELMYMAAEDNVYGNLFIWQYDEATNTAVPCYYKGRDAYDNEHAAEDGAFSDLAAAGGTEYIIFTGRNNGVIHMISTITDEATEYSSFTYRMDEYGTVELLGHAYNFFSDIEGEPSFDDYYLNGRKVKNDEGEAAFREASADFGKLIMFSGYSDSISAFTNVKRVSASAMTYDEAIDYLMKN